MAAATGFSSSYTILFHGNCIDGWMSAYIAYTALRDHSAISMIPISPSFKGTWPKKDIIAGTHILMLDVSVPKADQDRWLREGALAVNCIDHHETSISHWPAGACPINIESCAAIQTWKAFYPSIEIPGWLHHIDRIDRWLDPTYEDRCIREVLNLIAHLPASKRLNDAIELTDNFIYNMNIPLGVETMLTKGKEILDAKDAELLGYLKYGIVYDITEDHISMWNLPSAWLGVRIFVIDNTNVMFDTTEAAHLVFTHYPDIQMFVNYRKKRVTGRHLPADKDYMVYSARSRGVDLTCSPNIFYGHKTAAGTTITVSETPILPFVALVAA